MVNIQWSMFIGLLLAASSSWAQRSCGLWLNEVPLVADTVGGTIYATIEPGIGHSLKGTLRWDESMHRGVTLGDVPLENGKQGNLEVPDWSMNATNTITIENDENRQWTLRFSTLPFVVIDCPLKEMKSTYSMTKGTEGHYIKFPGYISVIDARCRTNLKDSDLQIGRAHV